VRLFSRFRQRLDFPDDLEEAIQPNLYVVIVVLALVVAYVIAFAIENSKQVNVHFVFATARISLAWTILLTLAIGVIGGVALSQLHRHRQGSRLAKKRAQALDAGSDLARGGMAVGEPRGALPAPAAGEEVGAVHEGDAGGGSPAQ
jgi:uncharacterized integral membrane protein